MNTESLIRAKDLDYISNANNKEKNAIISGLDKEAVESCEKRKQQILNYFNAIEEDWNNFSWQMAHRICDANTLMNIFNLNDKIVKELIIIGNKYRWSISPYYLSLMNINDVNDEICKIALPNILELDNSGESDPMAEEYTNPAESITRRYPDRVIINVTNVCGMYCRFCQRRRNIGEKDLCKSREQMQLAINYIESNKNIRDVLITGGDPLTLSTYELENIISKLRAIKHVEIIRIGTRIPVTLPQRVDNKLVNMLAKYHPVYINLHFNNPREITPTSKNAIEKLANAGIPLGNQMVLLNGVNNNKYTVLKLNQELLKIRVKPYYIFHPKKVIGTAHFHCSIDEGLEIMDFLRGNTSGLAIPTYILNASKGLGKIPLLNQKFKKIEDGKFELITWENKKILYNEK